MPQKYLLFGLVVICFTILLLTWMVRDSLCELQIRQGNIELVAFLACDIKQQEHLVGIYPHHACGVRHSQCTLSLFTK